MTYTSTQRVYARRLYRLQSYDTHCQKKEKPCIEAHDHRKMLMNVCRKKIENCKNLIKIKEYDSSFISANNFLNYGNNKTVGVEYE